MSFETVQYFLERGLKQSKQWGENVSFEFYGYRVSPKDHSYKTITIQIKNYFGLTELAVLREVNGVGWIVCMPSELFWPGFEGVVVFLKDAEKQIKSRLEMNANEN